MIIITLVIEDLMDVQGYSSLKGALFSKRIFRELTRDSDIPREVGTAYYSVMSVKAYLVLLELDWE